MTVVSLDTIVQADATLIVGIVFIVTLKQALRQEVTRKDLILVVAAIWLYIFSAVVAVLPDLLSLGFLGLVQMPSGPALDKIVWICTDLSMVVFYFGMFFTAGAVYGMMARSGLCPECGAANPRTSK
jgi:hypothetical protein